MLLFFILFPTDKTLGNYRFAWRNGVMTDKKKAVIVSFGVFDGYVASVCGNPGLLRQPLG